MSGFEPNWSAIAYRANSSIRKTSKNVSQSGWQDLNLRSRGSRPRDHSRLVHILNLTAVQVAKAFETNTGIAPATYSFQDCRSAIELVCKLSLSGTSVRAP